MRPRRPLPRSVIAEFSGHIKRCFRLPNAGRSRGDRGLRRGYHPRNRADQRGPSMPHSRSFRRWGFAAVLAAVTVVATVVVAPTAQARGPRVWRVGTWHGIRGNVATIAAALARARPGDWILIAPGDYHVRM